MGTYNSKDGTDEHSLADAAIPTTRNPTVLSAREQPTTQQPRAFAPVVPRSAPIAV